MYFFTPAEGKQRSELPQTTENWYLQLPSPAFPSPSPFPGAHPAHFYQHTTSFCRLTQPERDKKRAFFSNIGDGLIKVFSPPPSSWKYLRLPSAWLHGPHRCWRGGETPCGRGGQHPQRRTLLRQTGPGSDRGQRRNPEGRSERAARFSSDTRTHTKVLFSSVALQVFLPTPCFLDGGLLNYANYYYGDSWSVENKV